VKTPSHRLLSTDLSSINIVFTGDGSYSSVYKVKRLEDGLIYALKKVKI
jgi:hypothetical protein